MGFTAGQGMDSSNENVFKEVGSNLIFVMSDYRAAFFFLKTVEILESLCFSSLVCLQCRENQGGKKLSSYKCTTGEHESAEQRTMCCWAKHTAGQRYQCCAKPDFYKITEDHVIFHHLPSMLQAATASCTPYYTVQAVLSKHRRRDWLISPQCY